MKKAILISLLAVGVLVLGTSVAKADEGIGYPPIVQKLVERFGLNEDEVKAVFNEQRQERQEQMRVRHEERLNQAVSEGVINEEQKQAILAEQEQMRANMGEFKDLTPEERQEQRQTHREEMEAWAEELGVDMESLRGLMGPGGPGGPKGGFGGGFGPGQN